MFGLPPPRHTPTLPVRAIRIQRWDRPKSTRSGHPVLLDQLVGAGEDRGRDRDAERLRCLEVNDQLETGRLLDRQIGGLLALEDPAGISAGLAPDINVVNSITDQAASCREVAPHVDRWNGM